MFSKITLAVAAASMVALPTAADARHRSGYYDSGRYAQSYRGDRYARGNSYYARGNSYYGRTYRNNNYNYGRRCSGTTGTVIGGVAGALLGRELTRGGSGYRRNSGTTGAIIGGAIGALAGRGIAKSSCRNRY